ncbi:MAG TPA: MgtC/SapB family protein, partial [Terrimicrobiaceae bacterium]
ASMILGNLMLPTSGRAPDSFVTMDVMRLPLGILTGMGFIGAGAILHKGNIVSGITTAATLWFTTVMGFCFGVGEFLLGFWLLGLGAMVLWCLEWLEVRWKRRMTGTLVVVVPPKGASPEDIAAAARASGNIVTASGARYADEGNEWRFEMYFRASQQDSLPPPFIEQLAARPDVKEVRWSPTIRT